MSEDLAALLDDLHEPGPRGQAALDGLRATWAISPGRLLSALQDSRYVLRARAADALRLIGDPAAVPALLAALSDAVDMVRGHAAAALGELGDRRATGPLLRLLRDPDTWLRWAAADALGRLGDPAAALPLVEAWLEADHALLLDACGEAIRRLGEPGRAALQAALDDPREEIRRAVGHLLERR